MAKSRSELVQLSIEVFMRSKDIETVTAFSDENIFIGEKTSNFAKLHASQNPKVSSYEIERSECITEKEVSVSEQKTPDKTWLKADIATWLTSKQVEFKKTETGSALLERVADFLKGQNDPDEETPDEEWTIEDTKVWLTEKGVTFDETQDMGTLLEKVAEFLKQ